MRRRLAAISLCFALAVPASALEVAGVKVAEAVNVEGKELKLNGAGIRKKSIFGVKVYVGALYLESASSDPGAIVAADAAKSVHMRFLRDVGKEKIMDAFRDGFEANGGEAVAKALAPRLDKVAAIMPPEVKEGQDLVVTYVPGKGTTVVAPDGREATVEGKDFADAMFRNWLGPEPADGDLKEKMLGK